MSRSEIKKGKAPILWSLFLLLSFLFFLTGCQLGLGKPKQTIILPEKTGVSIEGNYVFDNLFNLEGEKFIDKSGFKKFHAQFTLDEAEVGLEKLENPTYMGKLVNTFDYFLEKYQINPGLLEISQEMMEVVTITTSGRQFYDVFKLGKDDIAIVKGSNLIKLHRGGEEDIPILSGDSMEYGEDVINSLKVTEPIAGVLLGLRGERDGQTGSSPYRTLWITNDGELQDVYEVDDILFPRKEFWTLKVLPEPGTSQGETLEIKAITGSLKDVEKSPMQNQGESKLDLTFVGNNYISLAIRDNSLAQVKKTMTISVDSEEVFNPITIEDLEGKEGKASFLSSLEESIGIDQVAKMDAPSLTTYYQSFILKRGHGNWRLQSEVMLNEERIEVPIAYKPSGNLVAYDELPITWKEIKQKVPQAKDAFSAPGNSFLLIRTSKYLMMYDFNGKDGLSNLPLQKVEIDEGEEIIMAEWARGDFVNRWTNVVSKIGRRIIFVQN